MPSAPLACLYCRQPLPPLARMRGLKHCESTACRTQAVQPELKARLQTADKEALELDERWQRVGEQALKRLSETRGSAEAPPSLLWLETVCRKLEPLTDSHRYFLAARWRDAWQNDISVEHEGQDTNAEMPQAANALCAHCAGGCCANGGSQAAFVGAATLRRWLNEHPDSTVDDAIADYLSYLPAEHVEGHCRFQAASGCTLPREKRSDICNRYRCTSLSQLGAALQRDPDAAAVVITRDNHRLEAAVLFQHGKATPLAGVAGPDEMAP